MNVDRIDFDDLAHRQSLKSHTLAEIRQGLQDGEEIWLLDSGTAGNDDVLLYPAGTSEDEIRGDLQEFFFIQNDEEVPADLWDRDAPNSWSLEGPFDAEAAARRWPRDAAREVMPKDKVKLIGWACPGCGLLIQDQDKILWNHQPPCPKCRCHHLGEFKAVTQQA